MIAGHGVPGGCRARNHDSVAVRADDHTALQRVLGVEVVQVVVGVDAADGVAGPGDGDSGGAVPYQVDALDGVAAAGDREAVEATHPAVDDDPRARAIDRIAARAEVRQGRAEADGGRGSRGEE